MTVTVEAYGIRRRYFVPMHDLEKRVAILKEHGWRIISVL